VVTATGRGVGMRRRSDTVQSGDREGPSSTNSCTGLYWAPGARILPVL
jgi:hypothetical protein